MSFLDGVTSFFSGEGILSSVVKIAGLAFVASQVAKSATASNNAGATETPPNIDAGVRLQIPPASDKKVPVLYGTAFFGGNITDAIMTNTNKTMYYCITLCEKTGTKISDGQASSFVFKDVYWDDQRVIFNNDGVTVNYTVDRDGNVDRSLSGLVKIYYYKNGSATQAAPENYTLSTSTAAYNVMPGWTSNHTMNELAFAIVRVDYDRDKNVTGLGNLMFHVSNSMALPGDCVYDYMINSRYGAGIDPADILVSGSTNYNRTLAHLNEVSQVSISYTDQGLGAGQVLNDQFQINGLLDCAQPVMKNIEKMCSAAASWLSYDIHEGKWGVVTNNTSTSVASFNDSNIIGNISLSGTGLQDLYNSVKVEFPHRELRDSSDFVTIAIPGTDRNANEEDNILNLSYDIINDPVQAQYLGMIELKQSRIDLVITFETDFSYINLKAGDVISVTNARFAFNSKLFRIITVTEVHEQDGGLKAQITALEYKDTVYSSTDLYKYTRTDSNGIISIGNIGVPGTPQVTKFEVDARPRILIETTSPYGVVEGIEYWLTKDTTQIEANRSYSLIATRKPTSGGTFAGGSTVAVEYDQLNASNFLIKTRGFNATTVGPFSDPSGLINFIPVQTTNAIGPNTQLYDSNGIVPSLGLLALMSLLNGLMSGDSGTGSLFSKIFNTFKDKTGTDLVTDAIDGNLGGSGGGTGGTLDENWTYWDSTTEAVNINGVTINRFTDITFLRPNGSKITLNISFP